MRRRMTALLAASSLLLGGAGAALAAEGDAGPNRRLCEQTRRSMAGWSLCGDRLQPAPDSNDGAEPTPTSEPWEPPPGWK
jgi:hypothetical protein